MINMSPFGRGVSTRQLHQNYFFYNRRLADFCLNQIRIIKTLPTKNGRLREFDDR